MNGNVVMRERGVILTTIRFDTGGDHVPSGETVEVREVRVAEPYPGFLLEHAIAARSSSNRSADISFAEASLRGSPPRICTAVG